MTVLVVLPVLSVTPVPRTLDEARMLANVGHRARYLFVSGYKARWIDGHQLEMNTPQGETYTLDTAACTCSCPFFKKHKGVYGCKHLLGYAKLLADQQAQEERNTKREEEAA